MDTKRTCDVCGGRLDHVQLDADNPGVHTFSALCVAQGHINYWDEMHMYLAATIARNKAVGSVPPDSTAPNASGL